jgi:hypothetical protein
LDQCSHNLISFTPLTRGVVEHGCRLVSWLADRGLTAAFPDFASSGMWQGLTAYSRGGG